MTKKYSVDATFFVLTPILVGKLHMTKQKLDIRAELHLKRGLQQESQTQV